MDVDASLKQMDEEDEGSGDCMSMRSTLLADAIIRQMDRPASFGRPDADGNGGVVMLQASPSYLKAAFLMRFNTGGKALSFSSFTVFVKDGVEAGKVLAP